MKFKLIQIVGCVSLMSITPVCAEIPDCTGISFRTFGWMVAPDDLYYEVNGRDIRVPVIASARSSFLKVPKVDRMVFYRLVPGPEEKLVREEAAVVDLSTAGSWPLLIFATQPQEPKRYRVAAIADDLKAFPFPSCRFVNFTPVDLYAKYGDQQVKVAAQGEALLDPGLKSTTDTETRYATVSIHTEQGPRVLYGNNWAVRSNQRTLVFIYAQDQKMQVMRIQDDIALYAEPAAR
jgi:hypothetical protein